MPAPNQIAVAIMAFNRPDYLQWVVQNVLRQQGFGRFEPVFYLFQDGAISPRTGKAAAEPAAIKASEAVFRRYMSDGVVMSSAINLGVAMNFDRAERILFQDMGYEAAIFLEDDMLLQPHYFETMGTLADIALASDDIGMFSAYGFSNTTPLSVQRARSRELCLMDEHNWAFGITRTAWEARDKVLSAYLDLISDIDYRTRDARNPQLKALQRALSRGGKGYLTSQDSMKNLSCEVLGIHRINTFTNNARYIGRVGEHSTAEKFHSRNYTSTVLYDRAQTEFDLPSGADLRRQRVGLLSR